MGWFFKREVPHFEYPSQLHVQGREFVIVIEYSKKRSNSVAFGKAGLLVFRLSTNQSSAQAEKIFYQLLEKVKLKLQKTNLITHRTFEQVLAVKEFKFAGETFRILYWDRGRVVLDRDTFFLPMAKSSAYYYEKILSFLIEKYSPVLLSRLVEVNQQTFRTVIRNASVKLVSSKWGHCTGHNDILLNLKLINAGPELIDYVIIHELAHTRVHNHSAQFWKQVALFCPNYKELRKRLKTSPPPLFV